MGRDPGHALSAAYPARASLRLWPGLLRGADGSWNAQKLWTEMGNLTSFGQDRAGEVYFFNRYNGGLYQLVQR